MYMSRQADMGGRGEARLPGQGDLAVDEAVPLPPHHTTVSAAVSSWHHAFQNILSNILHSFVCHPYAKHSNNELQKDTPRKLFVEVKLREDTPWKTVCRSKASRGYIEENCRNTASRGYTKENCLSKYSFEKIFREKLSK
ncbi:hypothetical protein J6590_052936 [Homalodisca vitripennis]|nr:hypothetical protein J6590_052936 [Homalodisca vitripennis]